MLCHAHLAATMALREQSSVHPKEGLRTAHATATIIRIWCPGEDSSSREFSKGLS